MEVRKFFEVNSVQLADNFFVYAVEVKDIKAAVYEQVLDACLDEHSRQAERLRRLTMFHSWFDRCKWGIGQLIHTS